MEGAPIVRQTTPRAVVEPLVSVVIPLYNGAQHIVETLRCVADQTYPAIEVIVVDDESTDHGVDVVQASGIPLNLIRQRNARVSAARNNGLAAAKGDFVCFLDQDDYWFPNHVERQVACFRSRPESGVVFSPLQHWHPSAIGYAAPPSVLPPQPAEDIDPDFSGWIYHQFLLDCWALTSATMIRRQELERHGAFEAGRSYAEDWELWLRLSRQIQFTRLTWPPVLYRQHPVQGSRLARSSDFRTELLLATARAHGLASRDGRRLTEVEFERRIARYRMEFGYLHLQYGNRTLGVRSLLRAWRQRPASLSYLALAAAGSLGWRPRGGSLVAPVNASMP